MTQQINQPFFACTRQFADNAFKAQAVVLKGLEQAAGMQLGVLEQHAGPAADFLVAAAGLRDAEGLRDLWCRGVALGRTQAEQAVALTQGLAAVGWQAAESLGALAQAQQAADDAGVSPAAPGRKAAR